MFVRQMHDTREDKQGKRTLSTEEKNVPKRRSSAARQRRRGRARAAAAQVESTDQQGQVATATTEPAEPVDRNVQRREERRAAKAQSEKKGFSRVADPERFSGARGFYNDVMSEVRKVIWPDREQTRNLTLLVIALSVLAGALLGGIDWVLLRVFEAVTS